MNLRPAVLGVLVFAACGPPKFTEVQDQVFTPSCVFATCHDAAGGGGLVLVKGRSHSQLVGVKSVGAPALTRVIAGDLAHSYLDEKLVKTSPTSGARMPQGGDGVDAAQLQLVEGWISGGAKDD